MKTMLLVVCLLPAVCKAQNVDVKKTEQVIDGQTAPGFQVSLAGTEEEARNSLSRYLKVLGKTRSAGDFLMLSEPVIDGKKLSTPLYATATTLDGSVIAWMGLQQEGDNHNQEQHGLEKLVYDFGVTYYREKIQLQIDESLRALQAVEKQQGRAVNQNRDLTSKIESNKREKIQLEKSLAENAVDLEQLQNGLQANLKAQDSLAVALEQIKKVVEMHRERQKRVR